MIRRGAGAADQPSARVLAREGLLELGYSPGEADQMLAGAEGEEPEELIGSALRVGRDGGG